MDSYLAQPVKTERYDLLLRKATGLELRTLHSQAWSRQVRQAASGGQPACLLTVFSHRCSPLFEALVRDQFSVLFAHHESSLHRP